MISTTLGKRSDGFIPFRNSAVAELARLQMLLHITPPPVSPDLGMSYLATTLAALCNLTDEQSI